MAGKTNHMGLVSDGKHELYDGPVRVKDEEGRIIHEFKPQDYRAHWEEQACGHSYTKVPYLKSKGYPNGIGRVGPLSRFNVMDTMPWPVARQYLEAYDKLFGRPSHDTAAYNLARAVELVAAAEECVSYLSDDRIVSTETRVPVVTKAGDGVGIVEAPRGLLLHNYRVDDKGLIRNVNIIAPTTFNHPAIERNLRSWADAHADQLTKIKKRDEAYWRLEKIVRAYDPCLSCSVHMINVDLTVNGQRIEGRREG